MENGYWNPNQSSLRNLISPPLSSPGNYDGFDPQSPFPYQPLEASLSRLTLSSQSSASHRQQPLSHGGDYGGEGFSPLFFQGNANLQNLRVQNNVNGQMGFAGTHINPTVGASLTGSHRTAVSEAWPTDDEVDSSCGFSQNHGESFLQSKKQLGFQRNSQFPVVPCSNRTHFLVDSDQQFDGFVSENTNLASPNLNSQRLIQFRENPNCWSLESLRGQIVSLAKDQYGSRLLQTKFENPKKEEIDMVLFEVIEHIGELVRDQFGNYIIQKLVKVCNEKQRTLIVFAVTRTRLQFISICLSPHGTRVVQKLFEYITTQQQIFMVLSALKSGAVALATDPNGHHVIQHCLIRFSNEDNKYILNEIADDCFKVATNKYGCCVIQSCVEHFQGEYGERLVAEIIANALHLSEDRYGNYVVQHLLGFRIPETTENVLRQLEGSYLSLSCNKYGSNVVEKCLTDSGEGQTSQIFVELLRSPNVSMLLVDPFGNFVIQSALSVAKGVIRNALLNLIRVNAPYMRTNLYGKKVLAFLDNMKEQRV
ncbi:Pumilio 12 like [Actinidia chinensis var. chinensis]|uniref:Pumilio 12 like n=1 Tax=Actinidia chinensis var. chinensis TaxID=1590841 RepID=A0A2R6QY11_ACTCC|nr:Pumilio 12 like [Actinidia chinensis var. chinensis]